MSYKIRVSRRAAAQIRAAEIWWSENRSKAPEAFADEIDRGFDLIRGFPSAGEPVFHPRLPGLRRILLGRIRYYLYYDTWQDSRTVEILAIWHTSRDGLPTF
ncbi:MAG: type II toxin-antitoxin system RelE/ParE family toxin [Thermoanaerobaculia bacterium]